MHIGYHKTGTSWLQDCVFSDARAGFSRISAAKAFVRINPFAFEPDTVRNDLEPRIRKVQARNLVPVISHERLSGNPHSGGYDSKTIADRLAAVFPGARVLVVIREQTSMLVSIYKQYVKKGRAASFGQYVTVPPGEARVPLFRFDFLEYHRLIDHYSALFGPANVLVLPYELLERQPRTFLERIDEFTGASAARAEFQRVNVSSSALTLSLKRHANRYVVRDSVNPRPPFELRGSNEILLRVC